MTRLQSFREYLIGSLSNNVDENVACKRYKDFIAEFSQSKVGRFFEANKDREWFRLKYHPIESQATLYQQNVNFLKRLKIFNELDERKYFHNVPFTAENVTAILNLMDAVIIKLEDGPRDLVERLLLHQETNTDNELRQKYVPTTPTSVVIDDVSIETTLNEVRDVCTMASPNLLRIAHLDPYYIEEGHLRRKFIAVYSSEVNIREVCWKLSRMKLNNRSLSVSINRCLTERAYPIDPIANHQLSIINDIRNAIVLILNFDELKGLYGKRKQLLETTKQDNDTYAEVKMECSDENHEQESIINVAPLSPPGSEKSANDEDESKPFDVNTLDEEKEKEKKKLLEIKFNVELSPYRQVSKLSKNKNPILEGAHLYLVEFCQNTAAKYQLSMVNKEILDETTKQELETDELDKFVILECIMKNLPNDCSILDNAKYLDRLLWYLRIVHSFDYYKKAHYRFEDDLTLKLGVVHVRDDPQRMPSNVSSSAIREHLQRVDREYAEFGASQIQKYVTKDEERFNYKVYGKVITDELTSYAQKIPKPKSTQMEEAYKCRHCTRVFQKLSDIGRHFVSKHRWAIDAIELDADFFNAYLFDATKIRPCPPKELMEIPTNRFIKLNNISQMGEDPDLLQQTLEAYSKMDSFVREPAPRIRDESDPRHEDIVDYTDISFDDAI